MLARIVAILGDGMFWRRATDPDFDIKSVIPVITAIVAGLLNPQVAEQPTVPLAAGKPYGAQS
jgi:hypothetical protein